MGRTRSALLLSLVASLGCGRALGGDFERDIRPVLERSCIGCHGPGKQKSGLRLDDRESAYRGGDRGEPAIVPGKPDESFLVLALTGERDVPMMPPKESSVPRPTADQVKAIRDWIKAGASWPEKAPPAGKVETRNNWAWKPIARPAIPTSPHRNPIDAFLSAKLAEKGLKLAAEADRRTLLRRLAFDLTGLAPTFEEVEAFRQDPRTDAYEQRVDRLLSSPRYGERWARHWLDVVHFGETHGYDKDKPRFNAWPYRDYVIRAFNEDKPYARFVQEQIAGDILFPDTADGIEALGFISAGPWDFIGHAEVPETKVDGKIARHLDRDDMVSNTINSFCSLTVHCAQCHNHKFDPITQEDYYALQADFAAIDRADRPYDRDSSLAKRRRELEASRVVAQASLDRITTEVGKAGGRELAAIDARIDATEKVASAGQRPEFGWHSAIAATEGDAKWVQVDLGREVQIERVVLSPCIDDFNNIGAGFGFPRRYRIEAGDDASFQKPRVIASREAADEPNPLSSPVTHSARGVRARFVRVTATRLAPRQGDYIFALAEVQVLDESGRNAAKGAEVASLDSIEAPVRWSRKNLTDGTYPAAVTDDLAALRAERDRLIARVVNSELRAARDRALTDLAAIRSEIDRLPPQVRVYAGTVYSGSGAFVGTGPSGGRPRPIAVLPRGDVKKPGRAVGPGALSAVRGLTARFAISPDAPEGERRAALARWLTDGENPLIWRSIVNRVWQYHFGRGIVDTPNDFGRMGAAASHPELLEWLAAWFRDDARGSIKALHRLIVTSEAYRQRSDIDDAKARAIDADNHLLWRMNRRKLEAEAIRDGILTVAGKLDVRTIGGPSFQDFVIEHPEHSPHYLYHLANLEDPALHRRSVYRFIVRSQQQPWMAAMDCADPSLLVDRRNLTITPLQALAQLNDALIMTMASHFADRVRGAGGAEAQAGQAFRLAFQRDAEAEERRDLADYIRRHGLENACRLIVNLNEFHFVD